MMAGLIAVVMLPGDAGDPRLSARGAAVPPGTEADAAAATRRLPAMPCRLPTRASPPSPKAGARPAIDGLTVPQILRSPAFWMLAFAAGAVITGIMVMTFNMIPFAESIGIDRNRGTLLQATMAFSGMAGSILFGWVADRIGGARGVALIAACMAATLMRAGI